MSHSLVPAREAPGLVGRERCREEHSPRQGGAAPGAGGRMQRAAQQPGPVGPRGPAPTGGEGRSPQRERTISTATRAAISSGVASPRTTRRAGRARERSSWPAAGHDAPFGINQRSLAARFAGADAELPVDPLPERVPQPFPGLLVRAQRQPEFLLGVDQQLLVDHRRQDGARQQVADVVPAAGQDPLLGDVLARLLDPDPVRPEARHRAGVGLPASGRHDRVRAGPGALTGKTLTARP